MLKDQVILNAKGEPILLNHREKLFCNYMQLQLNALGYELNITTLTTVLKKITEQKFFELPPADFIPMPTGEGAWSSNLTAYRSFATGDDFSKGIMGLAGDQARMSMAGAAIDSINTKIYNWAKGITWSIFQLEEAAKSGNWDLVTGLEESRKKNWDLGIQKIAFLGMQGDANVLGLLNQPSATVDTATLTAPISSLSTAQLKNFVASMINVYRANCNRSAWPTHFAIPESDYLGLVGQASADFPIKSTLELLQQAFNAALKDKIGGKEFQIKACAYGDEAYSGQIYRQYALYNYDEKSIRMNVPVPYTNTLANSLDNFNFQNVGYGQFTGVTVMRPDELYYFQYNG